MKRKVTTILVQDAQGNGEPMHYTVLSNGNIKKHMPEKTSVLHNNQEAIVIGLELARNGKHKGALTGSQEHALFDKIVEVTEKHPARVADTVCGSVPIKTWLSNYTPILDLAA